MSDWFHVRGDPPAHFSIAGRRPKHNFAEAKRNREIDGSRGGHRKRPTQRGWGLATALLLGVGCATPAAPPNAALGTLVVVDGDNASVWKGQATFTVRAVQAGSAERVVSIAKVGEIHVGFGGDDDACRFVWSRGGLDSLVLYTSTSCAEQRGEARVCFRGARFKKPAEAPDPQAPRTLVVDGCADENDLLWSKVEGAQPATVGPRAFRQRCARIPRKKGCELVYLNKRDVEVATNNAPHEGFAFIWDGDGWRACFLEKESGAYRVVVDVEDACGTARTVDLAGDSSDLDD